MSQRVDHTGSSSTQSRKVPQSNGKSAKAAGKKQKAMDTTLRTSDAASPNDAATVMANFVARLSLDERRRLIAEAAYNRAEQRGFTNGNEVDDWLAAEAEIDEKFPK